MGELNKECGKIKHLQLIVAEKSLTKYICIIMYDWKFLKINNCHWAGSLGSLIGTTMDT